MARSLILVLFILSSQSNLFAQALGIEFIEVPSVTFTMGRTDRGTDVSLGEPNESPRHEVTLSPYEIGKYEVTAGQIAAVYNHALAQGYLEAQDGSPYVSGDTYINGFPLVTASQPWCSMEFAGTEFMPKVRVGTGGTTYSLENHALLGSTWYGAAAFCNWYNELNNLPHVYEMDGNWDLIDGNGAIPGVQFGRSYRLPTEAEWERAAAWDDVNDYHWIYGYQSDDLGGRARLNYYVGDTITDYFSEMVTPKHVNPLGLMEFPATAPVGWFDGINISPNGNIQTIDSVSPVGCYDMSGGVMEWCHDWYDEDYYSNSPPVDPMGPPTGEFRNIRGGSYFYNEIFVRTAWRSRNGIPQQSSRSLGFRLARSVVTNPVDSALWHQYE